jgi:DNA-binding NtrC family response regulator
MKGKILIYDDENEILLLCKAILSKYDVAVETLTRCEDILKDIENIQPDLILMDLWIPEIGGEKAIEIMKQKDSSKNIPVLIFSANAGIKEISEKVHADGYLEKPFSIGHFVDTIAKYLR